jgi:hypothetical protein
MDMAWNECAGKEDRCEDVHDREQQCCTNRKEWKERPYLQKEKRNNYINK